MAKVIEEDSLSERIILYLLIKSKGFSYSLYDQNEEEFSTLSEYINHCDEKIEEKRKEYIEICKRNNKVDENYYPFEDCDDRYEFFSDCCSIFRICDALHFSERANLEDIIEKDFKNFV